jgi:transglutaminase-like putative cysteine protease
VTRRDRLVLALPLALVAFQLAATAESFGLAAGLALFALLTSVVPKPVEINTILQMMLALLGGVAAWFIAVALTPEDAHWWSGKLTLAAFGVGLMLLLAALPRLAFAEPWGGYPLTAALGLFVIITASTARAEWAFVIPGALYVPAQLIALNRADPARPSWRAMARRHKVTLAVALAVATAVCATAAVTLPPAADASMRYFGWQFRRMARTGFSSYMGLDALNGMAESDRKVLRIFGPRPDYLRGIVYNKYSRGRWAPPTGSESELVELDQLDPSADLTTIWIIGGDKRRLFVPLEAMRVSVQSKLALVNELGVYAADPRNEPSWLRFKVGPRDQFPPAPPSPGDLELPPEISTTLEELSQEWTRGSPDPRARLAALVKRFGRDYRYSLEVRRETQDDPVIEFLTRGRQGHCEYFASAMTLMARSLGVPARLVAGYRVTEFNPVGGYHLVRERNAHAWVEAWIEGEGWLTYDPTPATDLAGQHPEETPWIGAVFDQVSSWIGQSWVWMMQQDPLNFIIVGVISLFLYLGIRQLVTWLRKRSGSVQETWGFDDPRPSLLLLLGLLSERGEPKGPHEPLELYARRVGTSSELVGDGPEASLLLLRYAAWRYGGEGDPEQLDVEIESWVEGRSGGRGLVG